MIRCKRCCLHSWMRMGNLIINLCGVAMIIYSLWLLKKWKLGVAELPLVPLFPKPWFMYTCLGVGIVVCFSTLYGHMVANCINDDSTLLIYIVSICSLLLLQVSLIIVIFIRTNWDVQIEKYIDDGHKQFRSFVIYHLRTCRMVVIVTLVPQINVIVVAIILWAKGVEQRREYNYSNMPDYEFHQSFLVLPYSPLSGISRQSCWNCEQSSPQYTNPSYLSYIIRAFRMRFQRRVILH